MDLSQSSPSAGGSTECEGLVGGEPGADRAPCAWLRIMPKGREQLVRCSRGPGVRSTGDTATPQRGPAEGQYTSFQDL